MKQNLYKLLALFFVGIYVWAFVGLSSTWAQDATGEPAATVEAVPDAPVIVPEDSQVIVVTVPAAEPAPESDDEITVIATIVIAVGISVVSIVYAIVRGSGVSQKAEQLLQNLEMQKAYFERRFDASDAKTQEMIRTAVSLGRAGAPWTPTDVDDRFVKWLNEVSDGKPSQPTPPNQPVG